MTEKTILCCALLSSFTSSAALSKNLPMSQRNIAALKFQDILPKSSIIENIDEIAIKDETYSVIKYSIDEKPFIRVFDSALKEHPLNENLLPVDWIGDELKAILYGSLDENSLINIMVVPKESPKQYLAPISATVEAKDGKPVKFVFDSKTVAEDEFYRLQNTAQEINFHSLVVQERSRVDNLTKILNLEGFNTDTNQESVELSISGSASYVHLSVKLGDLKINLAALEQLSSGLDIQRKGTHDSLASAMLSTQITDSAHLTGSKGQNTGIYWSEESCPISTMYTNYVVHAAGSGSTNHSTNVGGILRAVSPNATIYCKGGGASYGAQLPNTSWLPGVNGGSRMEAASYSYAFQNGSADYLTYDQSWDDAIYNTGLPTFKSNGNNGNNGYVSSPGKGPNTIAVGNFIDSTNSNTLNTSSSGLDYRIEKPEILAPGTNINAGGFTMTGTSQAAPHAAAFLANIIGSDWPFFSRRPQAAKAVMIAGASNPVTGGTTEALGVNRGIGYFKSIDFFAASSIMGPYSVFDTQDSSDFLPGNGYIDRNFTIYNLSNKIVVVLSFASVGTYIYNHRTAVEPMGRDYDLKVWDPNGNLVDSSISSVESVEKIVFTPTMVGTYRVGIQRYSSADTTYGIDLGLVVGYQPL